MRKQIIWNEPGVRQETQRSLAETLHPTRTASSLTQLHKNLARV